jgi:hypothetical protein
VVNLQGFSTHDLALAPSSTFGNVDQPSTSSKSSPAGCIGFDAFAVDDRSPTKLAVSLRHEQIEAPEVVLDREHVDTAETGLGGVGADGVGPDQQQEPPARF